MYASLTGLRAAQTDLATISNNVANVGSTGFKKSRASFADLYARGALQTSKMTAGIGTHLQGITQNFSQGTIEATERTLDLAITGQGLFVTKSRGGEVSYTRAGALSPDHDGVVRDLAGNALQLTPPGGGTALSDFVVPAFKPGTTDVALANISIGTQGIVTAAWADGSQSPLGRVALATFPSETGLRAIGDGHWQATGDSGTATIGNPDSGPFGAIQSGALERANVDLTEELVALIGAQRNFQANAKAIETSNAMTQTIMNLRN
jgi:flagellar hook protein FlgE